MSVVQIGEGLNDSVFSAFRVSESYQSLRDSSVFADPGMLLNALHDLFGDSVKHIWEHNIDA